MTGNNMDRHIWVCAKIGYPITHQRMIVLLRHPTKTYKNNMGRDAQFMSTPCRPWNTAAFPFARRGIPSFHDARDIPKTTAEVCGVAARVGLFDLLPTARVRCGSLSATAEYRSRFQGPISKNLRPQWVVKC